MSAITKMERPEAREGKDLPTALGTPSRLDGQPAGCCKMTLTPRMILKMKQVPLLGTSPGSAFYPHASP